MPSSLYGHLAVAACNLRLSTEDLLNEIAQEWLNGDSQPSEVPEQQEEAPQPAPSYHSVIEIRDLVRGLLPELMAHFGRSGFHVRSLRKFLEQKVALRPGDHASLGKGQTRWSSQVWNAVVFWPESPIVKTEIRGWYQIAPFYFDPQAVEA